MHFKKINLKNRKIFQDNWESLDNWNNRSLCSKKYADYKSLKDNN